jgi:glycosyltransferase 2 family protein
MTHDNVMRRAAYAIGALAFLVSIVFLAAFVFKNWASVPSVSAIEPVFITLSAMAYAISHITTGLSWPLSVRALGMPLAIKLGMVIGLVAQVGKYLPGNFAHFVGRASLAADSGVTIKTSGASTALELLAAILAAALVVACSLLIDTNMQRHVTSPSTFIPNLGLASSVAIVVLFAGVAIFMHRNAISASAILFPTACLSTSFLLSGCSFTFLLEAFAVNDLSYFSITAMFTAAWLAGFLIPGSPAGLGVREAAIVAFLTPHAGPGTAIGAAMMHRIITAIVDLTAALTGYLIWMRLKKKKSANELLSASAGSQG